MKIETRFNLSDICYYIEDNRIKEYWIEKIEFSVCKGYYEQEKILYTISKSGSSICVTEKDIFKNIEEALQFLENHVL